jgi:hypothetical protein
MSTLGNIRVDIERRRWLLLFLSLYQFISFLKDKNILNLFLKLGSQK